MKWVVFTDFLFFLSIKSFQRIFILFYAVIYPPFLNVIYSYKSQMLWKLFWTIGRSGSILQIVKCYMRKNFLKALASNIYLKMATMEKLFGTLFNIQIWSVNFYSIDLLISTDNLSTCTKLYSKALNTMHMTCLVMV